jgi:hypothetical protein
VTVPPPNKRACKPYPSPIRKLRDWIDPVRFDVALHSLRRGEIRLALGILVWPSGWSHTRRDA